jgi:ferrous iron transport protein A
MRVILNYNQVIESSEDAVPADRPFPTPVQGLSLGELPLLTEARIIAVEGAESSGTADLAERLAEIGFLPGERVRLLARALLGGPLAVRVGSDTFALRQNEAACVRVEALGAAEAAR